MADREEKLLELCSRLRGLREERAISLEEASARTRIRVPLLEALEEGRLDALPGLVYARGFLRTYLNFLGASHLWEEFEALLPQPDAEGSGTVMGGAVPPARGFRKISRRWVYLLLFLALFAALYVVWDKRGQVRQPLMPPSSETEREHETPPPVTEPPSTEEPAPAPAPAPTTEEQEAKPTEPSSAAPAETPLHADGGGQGLVSGEVVSRDAAAGPDLSADIAWLRGISVDVAPLETAAAIPSDSLRIVGRGACWVRVAEGEKVLFQGTLQKGDIKVFEITAATRLRFGNAANVDVHWREETAAPLHNRADVVTYLVVPGQPMKRI